MPDILYYLLKLFISLCLVYFFYRVVLRKLTFYTLNRWYLILYTIISFIIPFINIGFLLEKNHWKDIEAIHYIPILEKYTFDSSTISSETPVFNVWSVIISIMLVGIILMLGRLAIQYVSVRKIRKSAILLYNENLRLYHVDKNIIPFSFGNAIYVNPELHSEEDLKEIIRHEFVHVKQKHSIDILWSEFLCIINWYNPFAWLLRTAIRQNLEFIADYNVIQNGFDRKQYQFLLLKVIGVSNFSVANQFNYSSLKKRIAMMNKMKSARLNLVKFLFALPLAVILLLAFRKSENRISPNWNEQDVTDTIPGDKQIISIHRDDNMNKEQKAFFDKNQSVKILQWNFPERTVEIFKKNGEVEKYDMSKDEKQVEAIYGKIPYPIISGFYSTTGKINKKGFDIEIIGINGHCTVVVKNNKKKIIESVDLLKWEEKKDYYENLYGVIPPPPPPPAPPIKSTSAVSSTNVINEIVQAEPVTSTTVALAPLVNSGNTVLANPVATTSVSIGIKANIANTIQVNPVEESPVSISSTANSSNTVQVNPQIATSASVSSVAGSRNAISSVEGYVHNDVAAPVLGPDDLQFHIYRTTTREELNQMILKAKEKGATLTFSDIRYNEKNQLISLSGTYKNKDDHGSFEASGFRRVILTMVKKDGRSHFYIIIKDKEVS